MQFIRTLLEAGIIINELTRRNFSGKNKTSDSANKSGADWEAAKYTRKGYYVACLAAFINVLVIIGAFALPILTKKMEDVKDGVESKNWQHEALMAGLSEMQGVSWFLSEDGPLGSEFCYTGSSITRFQKNLTEAGSSRTREYLREAFSHDKPDPLTTDLKTRMINISNFMDDSFLSVQDAINQKIPTRKRKLDCSANREELRSQAIGLRNALLEANKAYMVPVEGALWGYYYPGVKIDPILIAGSNNTLENELMGLSLGDNNESD
ncbi:hypothetical protein [Sphingomonas sanguinis]|uniref:hypothetical protein n=1 Tax=Sphingomonas sanguinis TaxID=33051 RepID=UPI000AED3201|nr:hypothetical protein [Sphingomonas sanguinis]